jgi:hypothetical protein
MPKLDKAIDGHEHTECAYFSKEELPETTKNLKDVEFLIFTDSGLIVDSPNYKIVPITKSEIEDWALPHISKVVKEVNASNGQVKQVKFSIGSVGVGKLSPRSPTFPWAVFRS